MDLESLARFLAAGALALLVAAGILFLLSRTGIPRLPGDFVFEGKSWKIYVPLATSLILSLILTLLLNLMARRGR